MNEFFESATWFGDAISAGLWRATWQASILIPLVWLAERAFSQLPAALRSWLWRGVYLKLLVALVVPGTIGLPVLPASASAARETALLAGGSGIDPIALDTRVLLEAGDSVATALANSGESGSVSAQALLGALVAAAWLAGCTWCLVRLIASHRRAVQLGKQAAILADPLVKQIYRHLGYQFALTSPPPLRTIPGGGSPLLVSGPLTSILLPQEFLAASTSERVRMALAHELAHFVRRDLAWNRLAAAVDAALFFHPLVWLAGRRYELAQELACDVLAVTRGRLAVADYANLVLDISTADAARPAAMAVGVSGAFGTLHERLTAMKTISYHSARQPWWLPLAVVLGSLALVPWSLAQQEVAQPPAKATAEGRGSRIDASASAFAQAGSTRRNKAEAKVEIVDDGTTADDTKTDAASNRDATTKPATKSASARGVRRSNKMTTTVEDDGDGWTRTISATEDGTSVKIVETSDGKIEIEITVTSGGKEETETYAAKSVAELKTKHPSAFQLYDKYTKRATARRDAGAAGADSDATDRRRPRNATGSSTTTGRTGGGAFGGFGGGGSSRGGGESGSRSGTGGFGGGFGGGGFGGAGGTGGGFGGRGGGFGGGAGGPGGGAGGPGFGGFGGGTDGRGAFGGRSFGGDGFGGGQGFGGGGAGFGGFADGRNSGGNFGGGFGGFGGDARQMLRKQLEELKKSAGDNEQLLDLINRMLDDVDQNGGKNDADKDGGGKDE